MRITWKHLIWISILGFIALVWLIVGLTVVFYPEILPASQGQMLRDETATYDVAIIFNAGGWGDTPLDQATDFTPVLAGMQQTLKDRGYSSVIISYIRTPSSLGGRVSDVKELVNSFKYSAPVQAQDIKFLADSFPDKPVIIAGFSNGGGLTKETLASLDNQPNVYAIIAGVPCWYHASSSANMLSLNNGGKDTLAVCNKPVMAITILKAPFLWFWDKVTGKGLPLAKAYDFPGHQYDWSSGNVGQPIAQFLESKFPAK